MAGSPRHIGNDERNHHRKHRRRDTIEHLHRDQHVGTGNERKQGAADRERSEAKKKERPASPKHRLAPDPWRKRRDHDLRYEDTGTDQSRRPVARPHGYCASSDRQHGRIGQVEQRYTTGEDHEWAIAHEHPKRRHRVARMRSGLAAMRSLRIDLPRAYQPK